MAWAVCCTGVAPVAAVDTIIFSASRVESPLFKADRAQVRISPGEQGKAALEVRAARIMFPGPLGEFRNVVINCAAAELNGPQPGCRSARLATASSPLGPLRMSTTASYQLNRDVLSFEGRDWPLAAGQGSIAFRAEPLKWSAVLRGSGMKAPPLRKLLQPYASLPNDIETEGNLDFEASLTGSNGATQGNWRLKSTRLDFSNPDGSLVGEKLAFLLGGRLDWPRGRDVVLQTIDLDATSGQALFGPVLFDLAKNPLRFSGAGDFDGKRLSFSRIKLTLAQLVDASGELSLRLEPTFALQSGLLDIRQLEFPAAYTALLQLAAAATVFGDLITTGTASGTVQIADNEPVRIDLGTQGIDLTDRKGKFRMQGVAGEIHWRAAGDSVTPASWLSWREGGSYGLSGGAARIDFATQGRGFSLLSPTRIPIFDGGLAIKLLSIENVGTDAMRGSFEGDIDAISMPNISRAFGWPELAGTLGGRIPRVEYRDKLVTFSGDVVAQVFGGRIVGSQMRLQDPLGPWPRFFADVKLENLDLAMVTETFSIGSITGHLEGQIRNMELFNWSPVSFDASLGTPKNDRGPHRISAKAIGTLSDIGNSGGGGFARLQNGLLKFFDEYDYARIGIRCQLANEICSMSGIERAGIGYFILQGKGLPHIDIVGNAGRVNWPALVGQISDAMQDSGSNIEIRK